MTKKDKVLIFRIALELISGIMLINAVNELNDYGVVSWLTVSMALLGILLIVFSVRDFLELKKK